MFNINDYIMYGMTGVCKVIDITSENFVNDVQREYYVLNPLYSDDTIIKTPVDNKRIPMRKIISKDDVASLINDMPNIDTSWIDNDKIRNAEFKTMLRSCQCEDLIKIIRSVYFNKEYTKSLGKKSNQADIDIMREAERLLNEEFSIILNISPDEVTSYISSQIPQ